MSDKEEVLEEAWHLYEECACQISLGRCIRQVCSQMRAKEHKLLSLLDGNVALQYFNEHYDDKYEQQLNLLGGE